jgi:hypothetical protein
MNVFHIYFMEINLIFFISLFSSLLDIIYNAELMVLTIIYVLNRYFMDLIYILSFFISLFISQDLNYLHPLNNILA